MRIVLSVKRSILASQPGIGFLLICTCAMILLHLTREAVLTWVDRNAIYTVYALMDWRVWFPLMFALQVKNFATSTTVDELRVTPNGVAMFVGRLLKLIILFAIFLYFMSRFVRFAHQYIQYSVATSVFASTSWGAMLVGRMDFTFEAIANVAIMQTLVIASWLLADITKFLFCFVLLCGQIDKTWKLAMSTVLLLFLNAVSEVFNNPFFYLRDVFGGQSSLVMNLTLEELIALDRSAVYLIPVFLVPFLLISHLCKVILLDVLQKDQATA